MTHTGGVRMGGVGGAVVGSCAFSETGFSCSGGGANWETGPGVLDAPSNGSATNCSHSEVSMSEGSTGESRVKEGSVI